MSGYGGGASPEGPQLSAGGERIVEPSRLEARRTLTAIQRALKALTAAGEVVEEAIDFAKNYANKHLGNIPDDAGTDRRAATADEKDGGGRAFQGLTAIGDLAADIQGNTSVFGGTLFVDAAEDFAIGSEGAPDVYVLPILLPHTSFIFPPQAGGEVYNAGFYSPVNLITLFAAATIVLPIGVTITSIALRSRRTNVTDVARVLCFRVDDIGVQTVLTTVTQATLGLQTTSAVLSETTTTERYALQMEITSTVAATDTEFHYVLITYQKSTLRTSI